MNLKKSYVVLLRKSEGLYNNDESGVVSCRKKISCVE